MRITKVADATVPVRNTLRKGHKKKNHRCHLYPQFLDSNVENGEYSYPKALKSIDKSYKKYLVGHADKPHKFADIRLEREKLVVLVETKDKFTKKNIADGMEQLQQYLTYESQLPNHKKVVAILAATETNDVRVWQDGFNIIDEAHVDPNEKNIRTMDE